MQSVSSRIWTRVAVSISFDDNDYTTDKVTRVQILDAADRISHSTNTLGKGMNPIIPPPAMGK